MRASLEELIHIKKAMDSEKNARVFKRYQALYLYLSGKTCEETAAIVNISKNTVSNIHMIYKNQRLSGIPDKTIPGRPSRLSADQQAVLRAILEKVPSELGFQAEFNWTVGLVAKYIKHEYGYDDSIHGITGKLDRMGLSYTQPTYVLAEADKEKQEQFVRDFDAVKKNCWMVKSSKSFL